jgi:hypothetical protein
MKGFVVVLGIVSLARAHSWVERIYVLAEGVISGNPGYPRGNGNLKPYI